MDKFDQEIVITDCNKSKTIGSGTSRQPSLSIIIRPVRKRYFILFMFMLLTALKSFQWVCLASITNVAAEFYQVSEMAIEATTILFMVTFIVLALPANLIMTQIGLRNSILVGSIGSTLGALVKCFSCYQSGFAIYLLGHLIVGLSEPLFFSSYSQVASVWYPDSQVSLATSLSLLSQELGTALGFIVPTLLIGGMSKQQPEAIGLALFWLQTSQVILLAANTSLIGCFFDDRPQFAPGFARSKQLQLLGPTRRPQGLQFSHHQWVEQQPEVQELGKLMSASAPSLPIVENTNVVVACADPKSRCVRLCGEAGGQVKRLVLLLGEKNFGLLFVGFGINVGVAYSLHSFLNQLIHAEHLLDTPTTTRADGGPQPAGPLLGVAGGLLVLAGLLCSLAFGYTLDKFHQFKTTTVIAYLFSLISMLLAGWALVSRFAASDPLILHVYIAPLGFFLTGYACCGLQYAAELTYPRAEYDGSTLLNISSQLFGIPISLLGSRVLANYGALALGALLSSLLSLGLLLACLQEGSLGRQHAIEAAARSLDSSPAAAIQSSASA